MIERFTRAEYMSAKGTDKLKVQCQHCNNVFLKEKKYITRVLTGNRPNECSYCSRACLMAAKHAKRGHRPKQLVTCAECGADITRRFSQIKRSKVHFCTRSCSTTYKNKNKKYGTRRSKLEVWLESKLTSLYPDLALLFNDKEAIGSELDIYIPSLKLAIEVNGIFHYKPIYGQAKLQQIQENDKLKQASCAELGIDLYILDTSKVKRLNPTNADYYLSLVVSKIETKSL